MEKIQYKPEIDGLRAIAVLSVIFFHFEFSLFSGGYVGVDVFFVISGFLITQQVQKNSLANSFSFSEFYIRRVRRLFPALFFTILLTFITSTFILAPAHLERLGGSALYSQLALSNYFLWSESGYFDIESFYKPLLHMWSLSVEEQFYLFWPIFIFYLTTKFRPLATPLVIIFASGLSLYFSQSQLSENPQTAFYLTPYRVFEFGIGAFMVFIVAYRPRQAWIEMASFILGLALIGYSVSFFDSDTPFPGINALVPTVGSALIIYAGPAKFVGKLLTNTLTVRIGLISYSLYLAHWPIYVLYKYSWLGEISTFEKFFLVVASVIIASLMYRFIETPFRHPRKTTVVTGSNFTLACSLCALFLSLPLAHSWANNGWLWRMGESIRPQLGKGFSEMYIRSDAVRHPHCDMNTVGQSWEDFISNNHSCNTIEEDSTIVLGDSHAADLWAGLKANYPGENLIQLTGAGCSILASKKSHCGKMVEHAKKLIRDNPEKVKRIIYTQRALPDLRVHSLARDGGKPDLVKIVNIRKELETIESIGVQVYWYGPQIEFKPDVPTLLASSLSMSSFRALAEKKQRNNIFTIDSAIPAVMEGSPVKYISKLLILCPEQKCPVTDDNNKLLYPDYGHWTKDGGAYLVKKLVPTFPK